MLCVVIFYEIGQKRVRTSTLKVLSAGALVVLSKAPADEDSYEKTFMGSFMY